MLKERELESLVEAVLQGDSYWFTRRPVEMASWIISNKKIEVSPHELVTSAIDETAKRLFVAMPS